MFMRIFDFLIDSVLFIWFVIYSTPLWVWNGMIYCITNIGNGFHWILHELPNIISFRYRIKRFFYPFTISEFNENTLYRLHIGQQSSLFDDICNWLNENVGKFRWKIIQRESNQYPQLCFRHKSDLMGFKLQWMNNDKNGK